jgi:hypothetical protein
MSTPQYEGLGKPVTAAAATRSGSQGNLGSILDRASNLCLLHNRKISSGPSVFPSDWYRGLSDRKQRPERDVIHSPVHLMPRLNTRGVTLPLLHCVLLYHIQWHLYLHSLPIPLVALSKAGVCDRSLAGIAGSNPTGHKCLSVGSVLCCQ